MSDDHAAVINQAVALVTKLKVTPKNNVVSKKFLSDAEKTKKHCVQHLQKNERENKCGMIF